jgi:imidazolonepropionase-like amidohydrolase
VLSVPSSGVIAGQGTLANLAGWTPAAMTIRQKAALVVSLPRAGGFGGFGFAAQFGGGGGNAANAQRQREAQLDSLREMLADAKAYDRAMTAAASDRALPRTMPDVRLASLVPYVNGELPVLFEADVAADIRTAVEFADAEGLKAIIVGGREALTVADLLKEKNVPVIFTRLRQMPAREDDPYDIHFSMPAKLAAAGVQFAISTGNNGSQVRDLPSMAGMAAAFGLSRDDALRSVTLWPAQIFGLADQFGTLDVGKVANVVVTDGDLLEARTLVKHLFIDGRPVPLDTRHTVLYETHKDRR